MIKFCLNIRYKGVVFDEYGERQMKMKKVMTSELMSTKALDLLRDVRNLESDNLLAYVLNLYKKGGLVNVRDIVCTHTQMATKYLLTKVNNVKSDLY